MCAVLEALGSNQCMPCQVVSCMCLNLAPVDNMLKALNLELFYQLYFLFGSRSLLIYQIDTPFFTFSFLFVSTVPSIFFYSHSICLLFLPNSMSSVCHLTCVIISYVIVNLINNFCKRKTKMNISEKKMIGNRTMQHK